MASSSNKKLIILYILKILQDYSDENHPLKQNDIVQKLNSIYGVECERKSIGANIDYLIDFGYDISKLPQGGCYLAERKFENSQLKYLIDSVLYSKFITKSNAKELIDKLIGEGNIYFKKTIKNIYKIDSIYHAKTPEYFFTIENLNDAINQNKQIEFFINNYGIDKELHHCSEKLLVNPYELIFSQGNYYLIGNIDEFDNISAFRIDKISEIHIIDNSCKSIDKTDMENNNIEQYVVNHPYLFTGNPENIKIRIPKDKIGLIIDSFGNNISVQNQSLDKEQVDISFVANSKDIIQWALINGKDAEILSPQYVRDIIREITNKMYKNYSFSNDDKYNQQIKMYKSKLVKQKYLNKCEYGIILDSNGFSDYNDIINHKKNILEFHQIDLREKNSYKLLSNATAAIFDFNYISDFNFLQHYTNLKYLKITFNDIDNTNIFEKLIKLQKLDLRNTSIKTLQFLSKLKDLRALCLCNNYDLTDYSELYKLSNLEYLAITDNEAKNIDIQEIKRLCPKLKIYIGDEDKFTEITSIDYQEDLDAHFNKELFPVNLLYVVFGSLGDEKLSWKQIINYNNKLLSSTDFVNSYNKLKNNLDNDEQTLLDYSYIQGLSVRNILLNLDLTTEQFIDKLNKIYRKLRNPINAKLLKEFLK